MENLTEKEKIELFEQFLNETSSFYDFKNFIEQKGYSLDEFGIKE